MLCALPRSGKTASATTAMPVGDLPHAAVSTGSWPGRLHLRYARRGTRTVLVENTHYGPLLVQRPFYPEGPATCHSIVLHPPAGIVGGDDLQLDIAVGRDAHALITTPGAGKWYRSAGPRARFVQRLHIDDGVCEFLPQENIVHDGVQGEMRTEVNLSGNARLIAAEVLCLGRSACGERLTHGDLALATRIERDHRVLWREQGLLSGATGLLTSPVGFATAPVSATVLVAAAACDESLRDTWRAVDVSNGKAGISLLPGLLVARWLGLASEPARIWVEHLWTLARRAVLGLEQHRPRIWNT